MAQIHVIVKDNDWKILGGKTVKTYKIKKEAVKAARVIAKAEHKPLIIHLRDGKIGDVITNSRDSKVGKILAANVKRRLDNEKVKKSIAIVISKRRGVK